MTFLEELQDLFAFLHSLWGILAGVMLFFPLSAAFFKLIPVEYRWLTDDNMRGFGYFQPSMVISITTILVIFSMFWLVSHREIFKPRKRRVLQKRALHCFIGGIFSLILYLTAYEVVSDLTYVREIYGGNPALIPYDLLLLATYAGFFVLLTAAFMILGMIEYYAEKRKRTAVS
jgi:heme/copper-type cytochrome/quinol oxidase subunit 3